MCINEKLNEWRCTTARLLQLWHRKAGKFTFMPGGYYFAARGPHRIVLERSQVTTSMALRRRLPSPPGSAGALGPTIEPGGPLPTLIVLVLQPSRRSPETTKTTELAVN